ncbi:Protein CBG08014 [Caenorhabditis briggsae]|uniref:Protein CBG08014 n=1 Tax=Caenorhabditis briggsae TaxID=6238 RepID=A8X5L0_CAEBR|nr:Protein CBG08014 [Caenorhabditis briggsae]CAP27921.2 Protein CBG08014 [Caenorhabditis briggsae]
MAANQLKKDVFLTKANPAAAAPAAANNKKNQKATLKVTKGNDNMYDDYGGADDYDDYDDY